jgi:hypothetical protein
LPRFFFSKNGTSKTEHVMGIKMTTTNGISTEKLDISIFITVFNT